MSRGILLFAGIVCALFFANVSGAGEFSILSPDGSYKHDSALAFAEILKKLEDFTLPAGDAVLEKWIAAIKAVNEHFNAGDIRAASLVAYTIIPILKGILPTIPDQIVYAAIDGLADELKQRLDHSLKVHPATLADIDEFIQSGANIMLSAMSKTTPTAETLN